MGYGFTPRGDPPLKDRRIPNERQYFSNRQDVHFGYKEYIIGARHKAYSAINTAMVEAYWLTGKRIVEEEQGGKERADYGKQILKELSAELTKEFGKGFSVGSLYYYRQFYTTFPDIFATPWRILSWSHYKRLMQVSDSEACTWYIKEASEQMWSYRTLDRNISSQYNVQRSTWQKQHITSFTQWTIDSLFYFHQLSPQHNQQ